MNPYQFSCNRNSLKSAHQHRVEMFMNLMGVRVNKYTSIDVSDETRLLLAMLVVEELLEYLKGLGVDLIHINPTNHESCRVEFSDIDFDVNPGFNLKEIVDGACDIKFVITKALSCFGVPDEPFQEIVDSNNLLKFSADGHRDENGKWIKPSDHPEPPIDRLLDALMRCQNGDQQYVNSIQPLGEDDGKHSPSSNQLENHNSRNPAICDSSCNSGNSDAGRRCCDKS